MSRFIKSSVFISTLIILCAFSHRVMPLGQNRNATHAFQVVETAFNIERTSISGTGLWMWWAAVFKNPNPDYYCQHPKVTVTARDAKGEVVGTYEKDMNAFVIPGGRFAYGDNLEVTASPSKIDITPLPCNWRKIGTPTAKPVVFPTEKVKLSQTTYDWKVQGEVTNPLNVSIDRLNGALLFRDKVGKLLGGDFIYLKSLSANSTKPFMDKLYFKGAMPSQFDQFEFFAFPTSLFNWEESVR